MRYSIPLGFANSSRIFSQRIDRLFSISYLTTSLFAVYSIAFYGVPGVRQVYDSLSKVYIIEMTTEFQNGNLPRMVESYKSFVAKNLSYTIPIVFSVFVFAKTIVVFLFTSKYLDSVPYFQIYLFSFIFLAFGNGLILRATNNTAYSFRAYFLGSIITIPITFLLIYKFGINGAITSAMLNVILPRLILTIYDIKVAKGSFKSLFPWKKINIIFLISIISLLPLIVVQVYFKANIYSAIFLTLFYFLVVFSIEIKFNVFILEKRNVIKKYNSVISGITKRGK